MQIRPTGFSPPQAPSASLTVPASCRRPTRLGSVKHRAAFAFIPSLVLHTKSSLNQPSLSLFRLGYPGVHSTRVGLFHRRLPLTYYIRSLICPLGMLCVCVCVCAPALN
jgi:hypothetical protein